MKKKKIDRKKNEGNKSVDNCMNNRKEVNIMNELKNLNERDVQIKKVNE